MGIYINKGNSAFAKYVNGEYIDKTGMIGYINSTLNTGRLLTCVTLLQNIKCNQEIILFPEYINNKIFWRL